MPVHISSRMRTISATNIAAFAVSPNPVTDIRKPPSRPPSCNGMKNSILANSVVKDDEDAVGVAHAGYKYK